MDERHSLNRRRRHYHINQDYFKTWSRNMAYVLGLWCAKGCIYNNQFFDISLHSRDKYILKQAAKELGYQGKLYDTVDNQVARLNFSCTEICNDVRQINKIENIPDEYLSDFVRGYFDGNGNILNLKHNRINIVFSDDRKIFLDSLLLMLKEKCNLQSGSYDKDNKCLKFGKKDSVLIGQFIYKNNPELFLLRKYKKFQNFL